MAITFEAALLISDYALETFIIFSGGWSISTADRLCYVLSLTRGYGSS